MRECEQAETRAEQNDADDQPDFFEDETPPEGFVLAMKEVTAYLRLSYNLPIIPEINHLQVLDYSNIITVLFVF